MQEELRDRTYLSTSFENLEYWGAFVVSLLQFTKRAVDGARAANEEASMAREEQRIESEDLRQRIGELQQRIAQFQSVDLQRSKDLDELVSLRHQQQLSVSQRQALEQTLAATERQKISYKHQLRQSREAVETAQRELKELTERHCGFVRDYESQIQRLTSENRQFLEQQVCRAAFEGAPLQETEMLNLRLRLSSLEIELKEVREQYRQHKQKSLSEMQALQRSLADKEAEIAKLDALCKERSVKLENCTQELRALSAENKDLHRVSRELGHTRGKLALCERRVADLESALKRRLMSDQLSSQSTAGVHEHSASESSADVKQRNVVHVLGTSARQAFLNNTTQETSISSVEFVSE
jgi:chromosome segregation ATPase